MSGSQNRSCCNIIYRLGLNIVMLLTLLLSMLLFAGSFLTTCYADNMETQQVLLRPDNPLWNLLELAGFGLLFCGCLYLYEKIGEKFRRGLLVFTLTFVFGLGILLILFGRTVPAADALSVYNAAAEWILGNTDIIHPTVSYLSYYPQQIGLMAFLELLLRIWNLTGLSVPAWHFIKLVYVCLLCGAIWFQYLSLQYLWPEKYKKISCCYLVLVCCNLPMIMYSSFVYGEIPSFAALSVGCYLLLRLLGGVSPGGSYQDNVSPCGSSPDSSYRDNVSLGSSSPDSSYRDNVSRNDAPSVTAYDYVPRMLRQILFTGFGSILFLTLSVMLRKNSLIPVIAVLLVLLFEALRPGRNGKMRLGLLIMAVCLAVTSVGILPLVQKCYEKKAGNTLSSGVTAMSYLAMGMQEASRGCGWYNGFNIDTYDTAGMDTAIANEISRLAIDERLTYFREHPGYTNIYPSGRTAPMPADRLPWLPMEGGVHFLRKSMKVLSVGDISNGAMHGRMFCIWACWCSVSTVLRNVGNPKLSGTWLTKRRGIPQGALRTTWRISLMRISSVRISSVRISMARIGMARISMARIGMARISMARIDLARISMARTDSTSTLASLPYWEVFCSTSSGKPIRGISSLTACC